VTCRRRHLKFEEVPTDVVLGIDVGKADFHCALLVDDRCRSNSFPNSAAGFERLLSWLDHRKVEHVHAASRRRVAGAKSWRRFCTIAATP